MRFLDYCPKTPQEQTSVKPLSGIKHLMESHATPLLVLPQSKLVENIQPNLYRISWILTNALKIGFVHQIW